MNLRHRQLRAALRPQTRRQRRRRGQGHLAGWFTLLLLLLVPPPVAQAQQQFQGLCSRVRMVIEQELTIERIGYEATLEVTDNDGNDPITDFAAQLTFENTQLATNGVANDASLFFFVRAPVLENINDIVGAGVIAPTSKAIARWFIIPKTGAGGTAPNGIVYRIGCNLSGKIRGQAIPAEVLFAVPATITVRPEPQLEISYFQPRDVQGDDPFTPEVESPIPFTLGVLVKNSGYGTARKLKIDSKQPKIVENENGLLLIAQLLGARVNDIPLRSPNLLVDLGDLPPGQTRKGAWDMITSLSGEFTEFKASYRHASELGGEATSLIKSLNAYFIAHEVLNDQPGRDAIKDFLADVDRDDNQLPDTLFESDGNELAVNTLTNFTVNGSAGAGGSFTVHLTADIAGWGYLRGTDPGQARLRIGNVVRSDGKVLNTNNYWTNIRYTRVGNIRQNFLNIFDLVDLKDYTYTVTYAPSGADLLPPVTTIYFAGQATETAGKTYIAPETQIYFISEDSSPVNIFYSLTNGPFLPALPFTLANPGEYSVVYYATDSSNNREANKTNLVVVTGETALDLAHVELPDQPIFVPGDAVSVRPVSSPLTFAAQSNPTRVDARVDVFAGVLAWPSVGGVPSSPTTSAAASLVVGGDYVDYYRYRINGGAWSAERPVASPLALSGLSAGPQSVEVLGRSQAGGYPDASNAVAVAWVVDPAAPATTVTGTPATPTRSRTATLNIGGPGVASYRWTIDNGFYRAESNAALPLVLPGLSATQHVVAINGKISGVFQGTNRPTTVTWTVNPLYGSELSTLARVRTLAYSNITTALQAFAWDGRSDAGVIQPAGWYTIRVLINDQLGRTNFATRLIRVGDLASAGGVVADAGRGPKNPHLRGRWAVWQDQADGSTWQIYAQDLSSNGAPILQLTRGLLGQENPRTDGRYVVWQGRQPNGNWDIYLKDLASTNPPEALTVTGNRDEVSPAIDWPWVVYQRHSIFTAGAPWLVQALNLANGQSQLVSASTQDQLDPDVQAGRVVWQDQRDVGQGEIYFKDLETGEFRRVTTNTFGQYHPAIFDQWIVWQDNRNGQVDLYGFDLRRNAEVRVTSTPEDETRPQLDGPWLVCEENSLGPLTANLRLVHLPSLALVPITRTPTLKGRPALANGRVLWQETQNQLSDIRATPLPSLQAVFQNRNTIAITPAMVNYQTNAFNLLRLWQQQAGVTELTRYASLAPGVVTETATWSNGAPVGVNFNLTAGGFVWTRFDAKRVLDLGVNSSGPLSLPAGISVFGYTGFPSEFRSFQLLRGLGLADVKSVRMLDAESGRWVVAFVQNGRLFGEDFLIPHVAVLMVDMVNPVNQYDPR